MRLTPPTTRAHEPYFDLVCWTRAKSSFLGALGWFLLCCDPHVTFTNGLERALSEHCFFLPSSLQLKHPIN